LSEDLEKSAGWWGEYPVTKEENSLESSKLAVIYMFYKINEK
jgi:hypothetical protein